MWYCRLGVVVAERGSQNDGGVGAAGCVLSHGAATNVVIKVGGAVLPLGAEIVAKSMAVSQGDHSGDVVNFISGGAHVQDVEVVGDVVVDVVGGVLHFLWPFSVVVVMVGVWWLPDAPPRLVIT